MSSTVFTYEAPMPPVETVIDGHIPEEDVEILYKRWKDTWPEMVEFPGNTLGITCERVLEVPVGQLNRVYGKLRGQRIRKAAEVHANV